MKNNTNNNNIVELSNGYFYCPTSKNVYAPLKSGGYDVENPYDIREELACEWITTLSCDDKDIIAEVSGCDVRFWLWFYDGNVVRVERGVYSTQDCLWRNRLEGVDKVREYFINSFCDEQEILQWEIETSGKWIQIFHDLYINIESGYFSNGEEIYDTCIDDANAIEYFEQMSAVDLETLSRYFPKVISKYKDTYTRALCSEIKWRIEEGDYGIALTLVEQISAMTRG